MALTHEDQNVGRILESMLNVFLSKSPNKSQPGNKKLSKEEKRMKKFFKRCIRSVKKNGLMLQCIAEEYRNLETANREQDKKMHELCCNLQGIIDNMPDCRKEDVKCNQK